MDPVETARLYAMKPVSRERGAPLPDEAIAEIRSMAGLYTQTEIADRMEVPLCVVQKLLAETLPRKRREITDEIRKGVLALRGKMGHRTIAARFGIGKMTVARIFQAAGVVQTGKPLRVKSEKPAAEKLYPRKVTPEVRERILTMHGEGWLLKDIGAELDLSQPTVSKVLIAAGLREGQPRTLRAFEIQPDERAEMLKLRGTMTAAAIARKFGRAESSVRRLFERIDRERAKVVAEVRSRTPQISPPERDGGNRLVQFEGSTSNRSRICRQCSLVMSRAGRSAPQSSLSTRASASYSSKVLGNMAGARSARNRSSSALRGKLSGETGCTAKMVSRAAGTCPLSRDSRRLDSSMRPRRTKALSSAVSAGSTSATVRRVRAGPIVCWRAGHPAESKRRSTTA
jgi:transposase